MHRHRASRTIPVPLFEEIRRHVLDGFHVHFKVHVCCMHSVWIYGIMELWNYGIAEILATQWNGKSICQARSQSSWGSHHYGKDLSCLPTYLGTLSIVNLALRMAKPIRLRVCKERSPFGPSGQFQPGGVYVAFRGRFSRSHLSLSLSVCLSPP